MGSEELAKPADGIPVRAPRTGKERLEMLNTEFSKLLRLRRPVPLRQQRYPLRQLTQDELLRSSGVNFSVLL